MFKKTLTLSALVLAANSYAGEAEVRAHVQEVVGYLQAIEAAGIKNPKTVGLNGCDFTTIQAAIDSGADQVRVVAKDTPYFENVIIENKQVALEGNYAHCSIAENDIESDVKAVG